jgi:hypothetical protein
MRALGRRWYVVLAGLLLTAGLVFGAYKASPPEYNARALVLLLPSKFDLGKGGNPLLRLDGLEQPASILSAYFASAPALAEVKQLSPTAEFEVDLDPSTRGPVIAIDVTDKTAADTLRVRDYLLTRIPTELQRLQQEVHARNNAFVGSKLLVADREAKLDIHGTVRITIAALVVGLVGTGMSAFAIDGFMQRRRLSEPPPGVAGSEGKTRDAVPEDVTAEVGDLEVTLADEQVVAAAAAEPPQESKGSNGWQIFFLTAPLIYPQPSPEDDELDWTWEWLYESKTEQDAATDRPGYKTDDAVPEDVTAEVSATEQPGYALGDGVSPEVGTNAPFEMWPEAPWATEDARAFDTVSSARRISREP